MSEPTFKHVADCAVLVEFATQESPEANARVIAFDRAVTSTPPDGLREVVPAMVNALVIFDPLVTDHAAIEAALRRLFPIAETSQAQSTHHDIDVCYDAGYCRDLASVAEQTGLDKDAVIAAHTGATYTVAMYGFAPGYAYLSGVPKPIQVPRKTAPVRNIPVGAVMIAGGQCLATTLQMPTGWSILGTTPSEIMRDDPDNPFRFAVGDTVSFKRIGAGAMPFAPPYEDVS